MRLAQLIAGRAREIGIQLEPAKTVQLEEFIEVILKYNGKAHLTSLRTSASVVDELLVDSIAVSLIDGFWEARRCIDIGAGGGFPSFPLALISDIQSWVAVDRDKRKAGFLRIAKQRLGATNYQVLHADINQIAHTEGIRSEFDLVTMRALRLDEGLLTSVKCVLRREGRVVLFKHRETGSELVVYGGSSPETDRSIERKVEFEGGSRRIRIVCREIDQLPGAVK
ncbi:MAG: class I SAM-dependent methyltransferase [Candidatus Coatesbacteria bacterium]|nr:class I SAM-dependent methyltransferase [Candidatus Coatesbacteria bacterium]